MELEREGADSDAQISISQPVNECERNQRVFNTPVIGLVSTGLVDLHDDEDVLEM